MPRFGKDKSGRNEELDRQAAEEVERLTRRGGPPGMGGGSGAPEFMSSPLDMIAAEMAEKPRPSQRRQAAPRKVAPKAQQAFTPMPSGSVGSSFGPGGLNPGPRGMAPAPPPPAFGGGAYDDDYGGRVTGPPVYNAEPDEDEEMTITELALMDHAAHTGHRPEDLVMQYDASTAEEMRDQAMRQFYERQQARRPGPSTNSPFAPAGMRGSGSGGRGGRSDDPAAAGGALAQRLANRRRREEEQARRTSAEAAPAPAAPASARSRASSSAAGATANAEAAVDEGALARVLARRRQALGVEAETADAAPDSGAASAPGRRHASARSASSPGLRAVPVPPDLDEADADVDADVPAAKKATRPRKAAVKAPAAKKVAKATAKAPAAPKAKTASKAKVTPVAKAAPVAKVGTAARPTKSTKAAPGAKAAKAAKAAKGTKSKTGGATLAKAPAAKATKARTTGKAKTVFCIECGEKNPTIAKFCFNCGNRLAVAEG